MLTLEKTIAAVIALGVACAVVDADAQGYPSRSIRLIVPAAAGGNLDLIGRAVAQKLSENLGRPMIVENRPGASTTIGTDAVARSAPDGYTYLMAAPAFVVATTMMRDPPYDPVRDFAGVSLIASLAQVLVVHPSVPAKDVKQLIALAKARPGELNCVTSGNGSGSHLAMELFTQQAGVRLTRIPYSGDAPALVHLLGGQVSLKFDNLSTSITHINTGRLRALGVTSPQRSTLLPEVPAISETLRGYEAGIFNGMAAPAATPKEIIARVHAEIARFVQMPDVRARFAQLGVEPQASPSPEDFTKFIRLESARRGKLIKDVGITAE